MIRFALVSVCTFAALAGAMFLSSAHAQAPVTVAGEWAGKYICAQGVTALRLSVAQGAGNAITATFNFGPLPENPAVLKGAYHMSGTYDPSLRRVLLRGVKWIDAPEGYVMVGLDGRLTQSGDRISGFVPDLLGCAEFEVRRPAQLIG